MNWRLQQVRPRDLTVTDGEGSGSEPPPIPGGDEDPDLASGRGSEGQPAGS